MASGEASSSTCEEGGMRGEEEEGEGGVEERWRNELSFSLSLFLSLSLSHKHTKKRLPTHPEQLVVVDDVATERWPVEGRGRGRKRAWLF
jgi:hypothetical protein